GGDRRAGDRAAILWGSAQQCWQKFRPLARGRRSGELRSVAKSPAPSKHERTERTRELVTEEVVAVGAPAPAAVAALSAVETRATVYEDVRLRLDDILKIPVHP